MVSFSAAKASPRDKKSIEPRSTINMSGEPNLGLEYMDNLKDLVGTGKEYYEGQAKSKKPRSGAAAAAQTGC
jgi:hypothetical protein